MNKRERFAVIGLGHFGAYALQVLYQAGKEVIAIDRDPEIVREAAEFAQKAVSADATDVHALESLGVGDVDCAIVSLGERLDIITLAALHLKDLGVPYIAVKALIGGARAHPEGYWCTRDHPSGKGRRHAPGPPPGAAGCDRLSAAARGLFDCGD